MDDRGLPDRTVERPGSKRARTLVVRCWREGSDSDHAVLRGTVRDLSRGRAAWFEGLDALFDLLGGILAAGDTVFLRTGVGDDDDAIPDDGFP